jgi:hypothetical protein
MISVKIIAKPEAMERLRAGGPRILAAITLKMDMLMDMLRNKIVQESIPTFFPNGGANIANLKNSVNKTPAHIEGSAIVGWVDAGGAKTSKRTLKSGERVDWAIVQEYGVDHGWEILPFNKKALAFMMNGKQAIYARVFHPPLEARPFMRSELQNMEPQIIAELQQAFKESLGG